MQIYKGKSVFGGIAIGKISVYKKDEQLVKRVKIEDADAEMESSFKNASILYLVFEILLGSEQLPIIINYRFSFMNLLTASHAASSSSPSNVKTTS